MKSRDVYGPGLFCWRGAHGVFRIPKEKDFRKKILKFLQIVKICLPLHHDNTEHSVDRDGAIAQLVEQRTENPCVPGSIPGGTT